MDILERISFLEAELEEMAQKKEYWRQVAYDLKSKLNELEKDNK